MQKLMIKRDIRHAYHRILRNRDRREDRQRPSRHFQDILHAYKVLSDENKRKIYDKFGEQGLLEGKQVSSSEENSDQSVNTETAANNDALGTNNGGPSTLQFLMMIIGIIVLVLFFMKKSARSKSTVMSTSAPKEDVYWYKIL
ncbi:hypothetical protein FDP41_002479 [Naegleria fowleri]|uniref:J domain-containing protein n=1 Tax=Naegleria fowleri TaxID=5763 RepID=A0A6A5C0G6_NAEFO|nr:uncharacterized protein FDP41_002479 [Naegleria fowleri]KAF0978659.1 hypothetical protein FDP41_002479 [Naegleria fowleri]